MKLKELFKKLAVRAGIPETDANLVAVIDAIPDFDANDDSVVKPLTTNLITESEAENQPKIKTKFTALTLNGVDAALDPMLAELFTEQEIAEFKKEEKATFKNLGRLAEQIKKLKESNKPGDKKEANELQKEYNQQIADLKSQIDAIKAEKDAEIANLKKAHVRERFDDGLAATVIARPDLVEYAKQKKGRRVVADVHDTLKELGAVVDYETGKLMRADDPQLEFFLNNKKATMEDIIEKTLQDNDYIKKSDPAPSDTITIRTDKPAEGKVTEAQQRNIDRLKGGKA